MGEVAAAFRTRREVPFHAPEELTVALCLSDERGSQVQVASIVVIEFPRDLVPLVVVNFRDLPSSRGAALTPPSRTPGARHMLSGRSGSIVEAPERDRPIPKRSE